VITPKKTQADNLDPQIAAANAQLLVKK